jgi:hypothetical protein
VYFWANSVYFQPRPDHDKQCPIVIMGANEVRDKNIVDLSDGYHESTYSRRELILDLKRLAYMPVRNLTSMLVRSVSGRSCARSTAKSATNTNEH